jgi:hypothetical protein
MKRFAFVVAEHEEFGTLGLRPRWYPTGDPLGGMAAAHDILEHFPKDDGSTEGELMALGASLFIRADGGYSNRYRHYDEVRDPAGDFPEIWRYHVERENGRDLRVPPRVKDASVRERADAIIAEARRNVREMYESGAPSEEDYLRMAGWLAHGYMKAVRRYRNVIGGACAVASLFMEIERECDKALERLDAAYAGAELVVAVNVKRCEARVTLAEEEFF